ncbi:MAG: O-antigen ligase family protein [Elainellaceae cyanobacterium]
MGHQYPKLPALCRPLLRASTVALPYSFYSLLGLIGLSLILVYCRGQRWVDPLTRGTLAVAMGLLLLSCVTASADLSGPVIDPRPEALLQLVNFLPFILLFVGLPALLRHVDVAHVLQRDIVWASLPISIATVVEYGLKSPYWPVALQQWSWIEALRDAPHRGRPMVMFDHPNVLASYLVIVFGLAWGLLLSRKRLGGVAAVLGLTLVAIACTGSRNGLAVALLQTVIGLSALWIPWYLKSGILVGVSGIGFGLTALSLGSARWSAAALLADPRVRLWKIALDLIRDRPWLGWGLGSFKSLYPSRLIDPEYAQVFHPHNIGLLLAAEAGVGVTIALTLFVSFVVYRSIRAQAALPNRHGPWFGSHLALLGILGFACFDVTFYDGRVNALNWIVIASVYSSTFWAKQFVKRSVKIRGSGLA